jgi:hypothetical protein
VGILTRAVKTMREANGNDDALDVLPLDDALTAQSLRRMPAASLVEPPRRLTSAFSRLTTLHPTQLADLPAWWSRRAHDGRVRATRRLTLEAPVRRASGTWQMRGRLRRSWVGREVSVDLELWPFLGAWTKLTLEPQRRVHVGRRYFRNGHRALDALTARLSAEMRADLVAGVRTSSD